MNDSKHTPGPWEVVALNGFGPFAIRMGTPKGTGHPTHYGVRQIGTEANARLIAAAPEMYEALRTARQQIITLGGDVIEIDGKIVSDAIQAAVLSVIDAALAKAEGR